MKKTVFALLKLMAVQGLAQAVLVAMGNSLQDASIFVCFLTVLAPLYFPRAHTLYKQAFSGLR